MKLLFTWLKTQGIDDALIQPYSAPAARQSLEIYFRLALAGRPAALRGVQPSKPETRSWSGPGMPGRPSDTSAARSAKGLATPTTRSGPANDHPVPQRTPGQFRKLDAVAVLTGPLYRHPSLSDLYGVRPR